MWELSRIGEGYITADLMRKDVLVTLDVQDMVYPNETVDALSELHTIAGDFYIHPLSDLSIRKGAF